ncbi:hypothetical protein AB3X91_03545 [Paraburkholderia sp. BR14263]|uniref:hypothetical protein n=1 Tax=unclassified Paraburkholderia TaxID=2615204 RepID=UPI0034CDAA1F
MQYIYIGPATGITLNDNGEKKEVLLFTGRKVDLPDCAEVKTLVAMKRLSPVTVAAAPQTAATATASSSASASSSSTPATASAATATTASAETAAPASADATASTASTDTKGA